MNKIKLNNVIYTSRFLKSSILTVLMTFCMAGAVFATDVKKRVERGAPISEYKDVKEFVDSVVKRYKLDKDTITAAFDNTTFDYTVVDLMDKPAEYKGWQKYYEMLVNDQRIKEGKQFAIDYAYPLAVAEEKYGVDKSVIVAVIGIESTYGKAPFKRTALQGLATLAFEYPRRAQYFTSELESLLRLAHKEGVSPEYFRGSYAGAIGITQFMPSNVLKYGVDGDGDGKVDLVSNYIDAIHSVANYLQNHGWVKGQNTVEYVTVSKYFNSKYYSKAPCDRTQRRTVKEFKSLGVKFPSYMRDTDMLIVVKLDDEDDTYTPAAFFMNSCPLIRYNSSLKYASSVALLAKKIAEK